MWNRRRKASGAAEALPPPPSGQSPTLAAWRPRGGRRIWAGKNWLAVASTLGHKWVRTDELVAVRWVIDGHIAMRDRQGRKLIVKPADLIESPELLGVVTAAVRRSVAHGLFLGEMLREQFGLEEAESDHDPDPGPEYMGPLG